MNLYEYQRSASFIHLGPRSFRFNILKLLFFRNNWADWSQISYWASMGWGNENLFKWSRSHDQYGHHALVKTLKNLLRNWKADDLEYWCAASGTQVLPSLFKWWYRLTLTYFTVRSNLVPYAFVWEKGKTMDFSEIILYIKVGRCSQLN